MQGTQLRYAIKFVADMDKAVEFYRDVLGLQLRFESPGWGEFEAGETTLGLHPASDKNPAGKVELGFTVADGEAFYRDMSAKGVLFSMPPKNAGFRRGAGTVCRFRRRTLQHWRGVGVTTSYLRVCPRPDREHCRLSNTCRRIPQLGIV